MADIVIETTEITETLIAIVRPVVNMRGTVIASEGIVETGETAGVRPQSVGVLEDTRLNIGAEEAIQGVHQREEALAATGSQTARVVLASPQIRVGEVDTIPGVKTVTGPTSPSNPCSCSTYQNACPTTRPTIVPPCQVCSVSCNCFASAICLFPPPKMCKRSPAMVPFPKVCSYPAIYLLVRPRIYRK